MRQVYLNGVTPNDAAISEAKSDITEESSFVIILTSSEHFLSLGTQNNKREEVINIQLVIYFVEG